MYLKTDERQVENYRTKNLPIFKGHNLKRTRKQTRRGRDE